MARHVQASYGRENLCLAGGVALNCVANGRLLARRAVRGHVDSAGRRRCGRRARRGALRAWHQLLENKPRTPNGHDAQQGSLLGPRLHQRRDRAVPRLEQGRYHVSSTDEDELLREPSRRCWPRRKSSAGFRAAWNSARAPWAPAASSATRAARRCSRMMNLQDQVPRESFRPFAPSRPAGATCRVLRAGPRTAPTCSSSRPCAETAPHRQRPRNRSGLMRIRICATRECAALRHSRRSRTWTTRPACKPCDAGTQRPLLPADSRASKRRPAAGVLINTSFNIRGEPIVCTPRGRLSLLHAHGDGRAGPGELYPPQDRPKASGRRYRLAQRVRA